MQLLQKFTRIILLISLSVWLTACGGGGGGVRVDSIDLDQPSSPTYAPSIVVAGNLVMIKPPLNDPGDKYSDSVKVKWRNHLTGESGSANHKFSGSCVCFFSLPSPVPLTTNLLYLYLLPWQWVTTLLS